MKLESRVEALEQELKILKNEIQSTLLEIREQVLNHYYPELRAEEPPRAKRLAEKPREGSSSTHGQSKISGNARVQTDDTRSANTRIANIDSVIESKRQAQPFSDIFLQDFSEEEGFEDEYLENGSGFSGYETNTFHPNGFDADDWDEELDAEIDDELDGELDDASAASHASSAPKMREVVFHKVNPASAASKSAAPKAKKDAIAEQAEPQKATRRTFAALAAWVGESVTKVGKERTIQVVETYAASGGVLSQETKSSLLQLVSLASDEEPTTPAGNQEMLGLMVALDQILAES